MFDRVDPFIGCDATDLPPQTGLAASWWWPKPQVGNTHPGAIFPLGMVSACAYSGAYPTGYGVYDLDTEGVPTRRFERLHKEDPERSKGQWPDLLLIDGGAGQVSAVKQIMDDLGIDDIPFVGVAKGIDRDQGKEEFHRPGHRPTALQRNGPVLYFIQSLPDVPDRLAIGAHRAKRAKAVSATPLDDIAGVGGARKRALLAHFGSAKAVARADLADLRAVDGVNEALAQKIYDHFHERG